MGTLLIIYEVVCGAMFCIGFITGFSDWLYDNANSMIKEGSPFLDGLGAGLVYAVGWPLLVLLTGIVWWRDLDI